MWHKSSLIGRTLVPVGHAVLLKEVTVLPAAHVTEPRVSRPVAHEASYRSRRATRASTKGSTPVVDRRHADGAVDRRAWKKEQASPSSTRRRRQRVQANSVGLTYAGVVPRGGSAATRRPRGHRPADDSPLVTTLRSAVLAVCYRAELPRRLPGKTAVFTSLSGNPASLVVVHRNTRMPRDAIAGSTLWRPQVGSRPTSRSLRGVPSGLDESKTIFASG